MNTTLDKWADDLHVIGAGGIGTHVLLVLIEHGVRRIHLWDDDVVSPHNRPNQFVYRPEDDGRLKVDAAADFVARQGYDVEIVPHAERVTGFTKLSGIVISGVDTMASRKDIWQTLKHSAFVYVYLDARIGDEYVQVLTVDTCSPEDIEKYETTLFDDTPSSDLSCSTRQNPHSAFGAAEVVSINLALVLQDEPVKVSRYRNLRLEATQKQAVRVP